MKEYMSLFINKMNNQRLKRFILKSSLVIDYYYLNYIDVEY